MSAELEEAIRSAKILVVGAGGIGCELLKNLVFTGFKNIKLVDFDTIDVSNLNRQFLFQRQHIGKSKAQVAAEAAKEFCPDVNIVCYHKSITDGEFDVSFFKSFTFVMNALDNRAARNHVNRLCLAAEVPLIESGSSGYLGQVTLIRKGVTECYECQPKAPQKTFPGCTIRNTPSEPIHCIVWAKHLFNQLFGEADPDEDVSPDVADPELAGASAEIPKETDVVNHESEQNGNNNVENRNGNNGVKFLSRVSTRKWALDCGYDSEALYHKFFVDDILYLLSMANLWKKRTPPKPLDFDSVIDDELSNDSSSLMADQRIWSTQKCRDVFVSSVQQLRQRLGGMPESDVLVWDKDDDVCMDFVTACANIRCTIFSIPNKSRFETKSMAGNIIAAIATTNAIIAGLIVVESLKMLTNRFSSCCTVVVKLDTTTFTVKSLEEKVLKSSLHMVAPDVEIDDNKGTIIISSEEGDTDDALSSKHLADLKVLDGCRLKCDDFKQQFDLTLIIVHSSDLPKDVEFLILNDISEVKASEEPEAGTSTAGNVADDDDEVIFSEECDASEEVSTKKRKFEVVDEGVEEISSPKRAAR